MPAGAIGEGSERRGVLMRGRQRLLHSGGSIEGGVQFAAWYEDTHGLLIDSTDDFDGDNFFTMVGNIRKATPLFICMIIHLHISVRLL